jgi:hypothetical protein
MWQEWSFPPCCPNRSSQFLVPPCCSRRANRWFHLRRPRRHRPPWVSRIRGRRTSPRKYTSARPAARSGTHTPRLLPGRTWRSDSHRCTRPEAPGEGPRARHNAGGSWRPRSRHSGLPATSTRGPSEAGPRSALLASRLNADCPGSAHSNDFGAAQEHNARVWGRACSNAWKGNTGTRFAVVWLGVGCLQRLRATRCCVAGWSPHLDIARRRLHQ